MEELLNNIEQLLAVKYEGIENSLIKYLKDQGEILELELISKLHLFKNKDVVISKIRLLNKKYEICLD
ncbi:hypothetical protein HQ584_10570 [Patescibacteria group bacterium]|nr:hypothetical protein [Patescibacteria group bacterium]